MHSALFVSPDLRLNGGDKSLYTLLASLEQISPELLIPLWCHKGSKVSALEHLKRQRVTNVSTLDFGLLPREYCYLGAPDGKAEQLKIQVKRVLWNIYKSLFYKKLCREKYDFIHLNSVTLYPLIRSDFPFIVHIREVIENPSEKLIRSLQQARGIIFIDQTTRKPFQQIDLPNAIVLNNPFDMSHISHIRQEEVLKEFSFPAEAVLFSLIGSLIPFKGIDLVIKAFRQVNHPNVRLLIAGNWKNSLYGQECRRLAMEDDRIVFLGLMENVDRLYAVSDYVLRGDPIFGVGRSMLEGLYSGCCALIPGKSEDLNGNDAIAPFKDKIRFYPPGSIDGLSLLIGECAEVKAAGRKFSGNSKAYVKEFEAFVKGVL